MRQKLLYLAKLTAVVAIYFFTAKLGLTLDAVSHFATFIWPPTGVSLAVILLYGYHLWPAIFTGAFLVNLTTGASGFVALGIAAGNTLEAVVGAILLLRLLDFHKQLNRLKDVISFFVIACGISTLVSATIGVGSLWLGNIESLEGFGVTWRAWWIGDALGNLIVAPLILVWATADLKKFDLWRSLEATLLVAVLILASLSILGETLRPAFWFFPLVAWAALRFGQIGNVTFVFVISILAIWAAAHNLGPFSRGTLRENLLFLDNFMVVVSTTGMILAAALAERKGAIEDLTDAVRSREDFLSIASHELKTPLTSLSLQIQMMRRQTKPEQNIAPAPSQIAKSIEISEKQVKRLSGLVDDLLDVTRIQNGKFSFNFEKINISRVVRDMTERFADQVKKAKSSLEIDVEENIIGDFDHTRIEQLIDNLISNAIKYAPEASIKVSLRLENKCIILIVADNGPGIPPERHSKVFERFERGTNSTSVAGLGLGLFIVKEIATGHQGSVHVESGNGAGSKFVVELPLYRS